MNNFAVKSTKCGKSLWSVYEGLAFQSTPPRGRRLQFLGKVIFFLVFQSTPPRGRRRQWARRDFMKQYFNPRLREGGDIKDHSDYLAGAKFQSTPPRGRRHFYTSNGWMVGKFQSTPPRGRDVIMLAPADVERVFQSTPPRGRRHNDESN